MVRIMSLRNPTFFNSENLDLHDLDDSFIKIFDGPTDADNALLIFIDSN